MPQEVKRTVLSKSAVGAMRPCMRNIGFIARLGLRKVESPHALLVGAGFHAGVAEYYRGKDEEDVLAASRATIEQAELMYHELVEAVTEAERLLTWYLRNADDSSWQVHAVETRFRVELTQHTDLVGVLDLVVSIGDKLYIVDHKTTRSVSSSHFVNAELDPQVVAYMWAARELGIEVDGFIFNVVTRTKAPQLHRYTINEAPLELMVERLKEFAGAIEELPDSVEGIAKLPGNGLVCRGCPFWELCLYPSEHTLRELLATGELVLASHERW